MTGPAPYPADQTDPDEQPADPARPGPPPVDPVEQARPGLSTLAALLAIATSAPLAVVVLAERMSVQLPAISADLRLTLSQLNEGHGIGRMLLAALVGLGLAAPVGGWLARVLPPWSVLLAGLVVLASAYSRTDHLSSIGGITAVRLVEGVGAGFLLAATAALVGAAALRVRPLLAGFWAAAAAGTLVLSPRLSKSFPAADTGWREQLRPYIWLLTAAAVFAVMLAAASLADRRPRLYPRQIDLTALAPLAVAVPAAAAAWWTPDSAGPLSAAGVLLALAAIAVVGWVALRLARPGESPYEPAASRWHADGRGQVGAVTAAVSYAVGLVLGPTVAGAVSIISLRQVVLPGGTAGYGALIAAGILAAAAALAGALMPEVRRLASIVAGLLLGALGCLTLLPGAESTGTALPGLCLLAIGLGLALGAVLRSVGPLATAMAGGMFGAALVLGTLLHALLQVWRQAHTQVADSAAILQAAGDAAASAQRYWLLVCAAVLLAAAGTASSAISLGRRPGASG